MHAGPCQYPLATLERLPPTEIFRTPVVELRSCGRVGPALIDARLGDLDVVDLEHSPERITFIARPWPGYMGCRPIVAGTLRSEIPLSVPEGGAIRATGHSREAKLRDVVFPAADGADVVQAGFGEYEVSATSARILHRGVHATTVGRVKLSPPTPVLR